MVLQKNVLLNDFNSHAHVERDHDMDKMSEVLQNFNSHAHVERDHFKFALYQLFAISTHTLTWSVTHRSPGGRYSF